MSAGQPNSIPPVDRPHAPPTDDEAVYYEGSPLLGGQPEKVVLMALCGTLALISPILIKLFGGSHQFPPEWLVIGLIAIGVLLWVIPYILTKTIRYRISNYRIDFERGLISKDISTLELWHVEDISFHQSILDRMLGIGAIRVMSHDDTMPELRMRGLPDARKIFEELKQRIIAVKRQSGVMKLDTGS
ncbi:MAG TPA: PH domain-containing protein [Tepidisphaeraceae bacterium]|nr:PH domain-containing protein [Tepidisphaeraceae bacterium]